VEALDALEHAIGRAQGDASEVLAAARAEIASVLDWLIRKEHEAQRRISGCESDLDSARATLDNCERSGYDDEPPDCSDCEAAVARAETDLAEAEARMREVRDCAERFRDAESYFLDQARRLQMVADNQMNGARTFLRAKVQELQRYLATAALSDGGSVPAGVPPRASETSAAPTSVGASRFREKGIISVPLDSIALGESEVAGEDDYHKVPYETMLEGVRRFDREVRPAVERGAGSDYFREKDRQTGATYEHGLERLYDAFYGGEAIRLTRMRDGRYDVTNGYHRLRAARDAGLRSVPASVVEETTP
jgi:hypothetical protein